MSRHKSLNLSEKKSQTLTEDESQPERQLSVLIIEDVEEMREVLAEVIGSLAFIGKVKKAANTWEARLELDRHRPDFVLLDEVLPGENALDFAELLHSESIPTLLITGMSNRTTPLPEGVLGRIQKPHLNLRPADRDRLAQALLDLLTKRS